MQQYEEEIEAFIRQLKHKINEKQEIKKGFPEPILYLYEAFDKILKENDIYPILQGTKSVDHSKFENEELKETDLKSQTKINIQD